VPKFGNRGTTFTKGHCDRFRSVLLWIFVPLSSKEPQILGQQPSSLQSVTKDQRLMAKV